MEVCVLGEGGNLLAWAREAPPTTRAPLPAEATRAAAGIQEISGRWRGAPPGAGACTEPKPPLQAQGNLSLMASCPCPAPASRTQTLLSPAVPARFLTATLLHLQPQLGPAST